MKTEKHIFIVDHHPLYRKALADLLLAVVPEAKIHEADTAAQLQQYLRQRLPLDWAILELTISDKLASETLQTLRDVRPYVQVIATADRELPSHWQNIVERGLNAFIPKTASMKQVENALTAVANGKAWFPNFVDYSEALAKQRGLTPQQTRILTLLRQGLLNKQIADQLNISEATVRTHMTAIFKKLGVNNRTQAVVVSQKKAPAPAIHNIA